MHNELSSKIQEVHNFESLVDFLQDSLNWPIPDEGLEFEEITYDWSAEDLIDKRLERIANGNLGDYRSVGAGVFELRLPFGPGYRIYFGEVGNTIVLLLCAGDKSSQTQDIARAKDYWLQYKETL